MTRGRRSSTSKRKASSTVGVAKKDASFLAKLQMLRNFVGQAIDEADLSSCLRQCGYNVESAAERLITGQYKGSPKASSGSFFSSASTKTSTVTPSAKKKPRIVPPSRKTAPSQKLKGSPDSIAISGSNGPGMHLLLCQRWLVGLSTSRHGSVVHKETLSLSSSKSGPPIVRFRGRNIEGTLPTNLCAMLSPLLRHEQPLISMSSQALMEERGVPIGGEVPLSLSVYIENPHAFFQLFQAEIAGGNTSSAAMFFDSQKLKGKKNKLKLPISEAAFSLLQWAEYGDVPHFEPPKKQDSDKASSATDESSKSDSDEEPMILREDEFEGEDTEKEEQAPEWAASVVGASSNRNDTSTMSLPETSDPVGLTNGVTLRPYQRQALYWMMQREGNTDNREALRNELELLSELANKSTRPSASAIGRVATEGITCECGPVLVSDACARRSATIDGHVDPVNHPLWQRRFLAKDGMGDSVSFYVNELLGVASSKAPNPPQQCVGGILSDSMGLGKTVMLLSLLMKTKEKSIPIDVDMVEQEDSDQSDTVGRLVHDVKEDVNKSCVVDTGGSTWHGTTLVVTPLSLLAQWEEEIATKTNLSHQVYYADSARGAVPAGVDVIVTTYGTVQGELVTSLKKGADASKRQGLLAQSWNRVILDEAHCIKNPSTYVSKACCALKAKRRWCVTGTPIQNSLQDVFGLLKFLRHEPWCEGGFWKAAITSAMAQGPADDSVPNGRAISEDDGAKENVNEAGLSIAIDRVRRLLAPIILRRTKDTLTKDGKPILTLPPVETRTVNVELSAAEREFYNSLLEKSQSVFEGFVKKGTATKSWFAIFSLLQRLRQACDHVALTVKPQIDQSDFRTDTPTKSTDDSSHELSEGIKETVNDEFLEGLLEKFRMQQTPEGRTDPSHDKENAVTSSYTTQVANALSRMIQSSATTVEDECPICLERPLIHDTVITPCAHIFCRDCLVDCLRNNSNKAARPVPGAASARVASRLTDGECPFCNETMRCSEIITMIKSENGQTTTTYLADNLSPRPLLVKKEEPSAANIGARQTLENALRGAESSKLVAVIGEIRNIWELDPRSKVIVFSQFLGFLNLMEVSLDKSGIPWNRLDGKMSLKDRVAALEKFNKVSSKQPDDGDNVSNVGSVLLVSMKAGGVGLNLVAASSVFIVDPWWNAAVEDQCVNRIHRLGQTAEVVRVRKFVVADSVEERIVSLQRRKKGMASEILSDSCNSSGLTNSRPTLDDFKILFGN